MTEDAHRQGASFQAHGLAEKIAATATNLNKDSNRRAIRHEFSTSQRNETQGGIGAYGRTSKKYKSVILLIQNCNIAYSDRRDDKRQHTPVNPEKS